MIYSLLLRQPLKKTFLFVQCGCWLEELNWKYMFDLTYQMHCSLMTASFLQIEVFLRNFFWKCKLDIFNKLLSGDLKISYLPKQRFIKMKFCIKDLLSKCDQIRRQLPIWPNSQKVSLIEKLKILKLYHAVQKNSALQSWKIHGKYYG